MAVSRKPYCYTKMDKEDPEEVFHRRAQFLIYKAMAKLDKDSRRKPSWLRIRISKLKVKIGNRLRRIRKRIMFGVSAARVGIHGQVVSQMKTLKKVFGRGRQTLMSCPSLLK